MNRIDLAQFRFEQPPGNPATQPVEQPAWRLRLDFPHGVQRCKLLRQVRVALRNIGQQWQAIRRGATFVQRARDLRRQWFIVRSRRDEEDSVQGVAYRRSWVWSCHNAIHSKLIILIDLREFRSLRGAFAPSGPLTVHRAPANQNILAFQSLDRRHGAGKRKFAHPCHIDGCACWLECAVAGQARAL